MLASFGMRPSVLIANGVIVTAALVWLLVVLVSFLQPFRAAPIREAEPRPMTPVTESELQRGWFGFVLRVDGLHDAAEFKKAIDDIAAMNANAVLIETPMLQENPESVEVSLQGAESPLLTDLVSIIHHATDRGLAVALVPTIVFQEVKASQSRANFAPADWDRWWLSYADAVLELAAMAKSSGVEVFAIGSELSESEIMTTQWMDLSAKVREQFSGLLMYNAQWDRAAQITFWEHVDLIGVSAWFPLAQEGAESPDLGAAWREALLHLNAISADNQRPVLITAVGYPSRQTALTQPWDAAPLASETPDAQIQQRALSAFLDAYTGIDPRSPDRYTGFFIYRWIARGDPQADAFSHAIEGKPAEADARRALGRLTR